jgi:hypothetical protein
MVRRTAASLLALLLSLPNAAVATTAASLSNRITIDGSTNDIAANEWVLDATTVFPERTDDSRWGRDADITRLAVTWDATRLYVAVEFRAVGSSALLMIGGGPGGLSTLDATGEFRRAIALPFAVNVLALATPGAEPQVARVDGTHVFGGVDRSKVPAALRGTTDGDAAFEIAIPWSMLALDRPLRIAVAITGDIGTGAGDAAPDPRTSLSTDPNVRAVLDRWVDIDADTDGDGHADLGVAPRAVASVQPTGDAVANAGSTDLSVTLDRKSFAPDAGESTIFHLTAGSGGFDAIDGTCTIHAMDGRAIRSLRLPSGAMPGVEIAWDGRDNTGRIVDGGIYVAAFDVDFSSGGQRQRVHKNVGVAVVR